MFDETLLIRYGAIPFVSRFHANTSLRLTRGMRAVVRTSRGLEVGTVLEPSPKSAGQSPQAEPELEDADQPDGSILRMASESDLETFAELRRECETEYDEWCRRIEKWNLDLELIDLEWTLDRSRLILYVLNERGPDCTKLALQAAAAGLGLIEVQPVDASGLVQLNLGGGCGSGGCGCGT